MAGTGCGGAPAGWDGGEGAGGVPVGRGGESSNLGAAVQYSSTCTPQVSVPNLALVGDHAVTCSRGILCVLGHLGFPHGLIVNCSFQLDLFGRNSVSLDVSNRVSSGISNFERFQI